MMPLSVLDTTPTSAARVSAGVAAPRPREGMQPAGTKLQAPQSGFPVRGGLRQWQGNLNQHAAGMQQTLLFIDRAQSSLAGLKQALGNVVAGQQAATNALQARLRQFDVFWSDRTRATAGSLDGSLTVVEPGQSQQLFRVRGLSGRDAQMAGNETLHFSVRGRQSAPVMLDDGMSALDMARKLNRVLAPLGVRVAADAGSGILFGVNELDSQAILDSLMVKGDGRRFPSGLYNKLRTDTEPEAIRPADWNLDDPLAIRKTLQEVVQAGTSLHEAAKQAAMQLKALERESTLPAGFSPDAAQSMADFAQGFKALGSRPVFDTLAQVAPATSGLTTARVNALLGLR